MFQTWHPAALAEQTGLQQVFHDYGLGQFETFLFKSITSTMDAAELLLSPRGGEELRTVCQKDPNPNQSDCFCVLADYQSRGKGREGRLWVSDLGKGLYLSVVFPNLAFDVSLTGLSLVLGLAVLRALRELGIEAQQKWPNDIFQQDREGYWKKLGGLLVDTSTSQPEKFNLTFGVGLNLLPQECENSISLSDLSTRPLPSRSELAALICKYTLEVIRQFQAEGFSGFIPEWMSTSMLLGLRVEVSSNNISGTIVGIVEGISEQGALIISQGDGKKLVFSGSLRIS